MAKQDITGCRFGRLVGLRIEPSPLANTRWRCKCDCGNETVVILGKLKSGHTQSCGCLQRELLSKRAGTHRQTGSRLHNIWGNMCSRCNNPNHPAYHWYGGRGIVVADEWRDFATFHAWAVNSGYSPELQIDRKDNSKGYAPQNCRWVSSKQNNRNRSSNRIIEYLGRPMTVTEASETVGIHPATITNRLNRGWDSFAALTTPPKRPAPRRHMT